MLLTAANENLRKAVTRNSAVVQEFVPKKLDLGGTVAFDKWNILRTCINFGA